MNLVFIYLLKSTLSLIILYLSYEFFFRKEAYFRFSRYLLLTSVFLVVLLPLIPYNAIGLLSEAPYTLNEFVIYSHLAQYTLDEVVINANRPSENFLSTISLGSLLLTIYFLGAGFKLLQFLFRLYQIQSLIKKSKTLNSDGLNFVFAEKGSPTYSFLKWIFIDPELFNKKSDFTSILAHEKIHATEGHSYDLILAEFVTIIQWFNPFAYLLKKTIKENHEYITDQAVISNYQDIKSYQLLLLQHSSIIKTNNLTHNFSYSLLERRLKMMKKSKHKLGLCLRLILLATTLVLIFFACSSPDTNQVNDENQKSTTVEEEPLFMVVEQMPEFVGGEQAMYKFIGEQLKYPTQAKTEGIGGRVLISFIIEKDGKITNVETMKGIGGGCDEEAMRVIQNMPNWSPGQQRGENVRVKYRLPIKFTLNGSETDEKKNVIKVSKNANDEIFVVVESRPEFVGGKQAMYKYLQENIKYPELAKKAGTQGTVSVDFIVEKNGEISSVKIKEGIGDGCDEEAMRVIQNMPNWTPGQQRGEAVRVAYSLPIKFNLQ